MRRFSKIAAVALVASLTLAGCGNDDNSSGSDTAEGCKGASGDGLVDFHHSRLNRQILEYDLIDFLFDFFDFAICKGREMGVIESQPVWSHQRPGLFHMAAKSLT